MLAALKNYLNNALLHLDLLYIFLVKLYLNKLFENFLLKIESPHHLPLFT